MSQITSVIFAIDANEYSGNFEREMCAYVTGQIGECEVGRTLAAETRRQLSRPETDKIFEWIEEHIVQEADDSDSPCYRPCAIWPTPGRVNNGSGQHFNEADLPIEKSWQNVHWPAYESVAIFFDDIPPDEVIEVMAERAKEFALKRPDWKSYRNESEKAPLTISAFRILTPSLSKPCNIEHIEFRRIEA